jgi:hypothetical protein
MSGADWATSIAALAASVRLRAPIARPSAAKARFISTAIRGGTPPRRWAVQARARARSAEAAACQLPLRAASKRSLAAAAMASSSGGGGRKARYWETSVLTPHAPHSNARVSGREDGLGVERLAFDLGAEDGRVKVADREQRVCDRGRIRERGQGEVEALAPRRNRKLLQAGCGELGRVGCGIGVEPPAGSVSLAELPSPPQPPTARAASRVAPTAAAAGRIPVLCGCRVIGGSLVWGIC